MSSKRIANVIVEGNIGSGKSTLLKYFAEKYKEKFSILNEPLSEWENVCNHNLFKMSYDNPKRYAALFQSYSDLTRFKLHNLTVNNQIKLMERSLLSARYCFVELLSENKLLTEIEKIVLDKWFQYEICKKNIMPDAIIYIKTNPDICYQRVLKRDRFGEKVSLDYLTKLHECHENLLSSSSSLSDLAKLFGQDFEKPKIFIIDGNQSLELIKNEYDNCALTILN